MFGFQPATRCSSASLPAAVRRLCLQKRTRGSLVATRGAMRPFPTWCRPAPRANCTMESSRRCWVSLFCHLHPFLLSMENVRGWCTTQAPFRTICRVCPLHVGFVGGYHPPTSAGRSCWQPANTIAARIFFTNWTKFVHERIDFLPGHQVCLESSSAAGDGHARPIDLC